jgi:hypothetical protein
MVSVASQLIEEVTAHAQRDGLEDAREICADGTYFPNNLCIYVMLFQLIWRGLLLFSLYFYVNTFLVILLTKPFSILT